MRTNLKYFIILLCPSALIIFWGCSDPTGKTTRSTHPEGWMVQTSATFHGKQVSDTSACAGCHGSNFQGGVTNVSCYSCHQYPHLSSWMITTSSNFHGQYTDSLSNCSPCHGLDYAGGSSGVSCYSCHEYPHFVGWMISDSAGFHGKNADSLEVCAACHGENYTGGNSGVSCYSCHEFPHISGWLDPNSLSFHGKYAAPDSLSSCAACHGLDFQGGSSEQSCYSCHQYPHLTGWMIEDSPSFHGERADSLNACALCHGTDYQGGISGVSCYSCHEFPHISGWLDPDSLSFHGKYAAPDSLSSCAICHGSEFQGGNGGEPSCFSCHKYPHLTGWTDSTAASFHGNYGQPSSDSTCVGCHGPDFQGGSSGIACYSCHQYPHRTLTGWYQPGSPGQHGASTSSDSLFACTACHGADFQGGISWQSCYSCHQFPHLTGWYQSGSPGQHGAYVSDPDSLGACSACHGSDFQGGANDEPSCYSCHATYPHFANLNWMNPNSPQSHGAYVLIADSLTTCQACHGANYEGIGNALSCYSCHKFPHLSGWMDSTTTSFHGNYGLPDSVSLYCVSCHGQDFQGGNSGKSCYDCHDYPHLSTWYPQQDSSGLHATADATLDSLTDNCAGCHGSDFQGGISWQSCYNCHQFPHLTGWYQSGSPGQHGAYVSDPDSLSACQACHGDNYQGIGDATSCYNCHSSYPHLYPAWTDTTDPTSHGKYALGPSGLFVPDSLIICQACHGANYQGILNATSCYNCHQFPHINPAWIDSTSSNFHGDYVGNLSICTACHGSSYSGGNHGEQSCYDCHDYPHLSTWYPQQDSSGLHAATNANLDSLTDNCAGCHGSNFQGGISWKSCYDCHQFPHLTGWYQPGSPGQHGAYVSDPDSLSACQACHGDNYQGIGDATSCYNCHSSYPHLYPAWTDTTDPTSHGKYALGSGGLFEPDSLITCQACHGVNYQGMGNAVTCYSCHQFPHLTGWYQPGSPGQHGAYVSDPDSLSACAACHGSDYSGGNHGELSCFSCHATYPHLANLDWMNPNSPQSHGAYAYADSNKIVCQACHGANYQGMGNAITCYSCHQYPHLPDWTNPGTTGFHGENVNSLSACTPCHGSNLQGGTQTETSCFSCHASTLHLSPTWIDTTSSDFHGAYALGPNNMFEPDSIISCQVCHDNNYQGGLSGVSCYGCHQFPHSSGWLNQGSPDFHGANVDSLNGCAYCHGSDFQGGSHGEVSCYNCHQYVHPSNIQQQHYQGILASLNYTVWICQSCHGTSYSGGQSSPTCRNCHVNPPGPESCNTCHGNFTGPYSIANWWAPPKDLVGHSDSIYVGIGAHQRHLQGGQFGGPYQCNVCHVVPGSVQTPSHIDTNPPQATLTWGFPANAQGANPSWNHTAHTCSNTYCHGNFNFGNHSNPPADWTNMNGNQILCGSTCHQVPPPPPHEQGISINDCYEKHGMVINAQGIIYAPQLHANGVINVDEHKK